MAEQELKEKGEAIDSLLYNYLQLARTRTDHSIGDIRSELKHELSSLGVVIADKEAELQTIQDELCTAYYEDDPRRMEKALGKLAGYTKIHSLLEEK